VHINLAAGMAAVPRTNSAQYKATGMNGESTASEYNI